MPWEHVIGHQSVQRTAAPIPRIPDFAQPIPGHPGGRMPMERLRQGSASAVRRRAKSPCSSSAVAADDCSRSGRAASRNATAPAVMIASPMPINACMPPMAGIARFAGEVPEAASSSAQARAATTMDSQAETVAPRRIPTLVLGTSLRMVGIRKVRNCDADQGHVEEVGTQRQQAAVLKNNGLDADHARHHYDGGPRTQEYRGQRGSQEVARTYRLPPRSSAFVLQRWRLQAHPSGALGVLPVLCRRGAARPR